MTSRKDLTAQAGARLLPGKLPHGQPRQPGVAQPKTAGTQQMRARPAAPPVYRPQPAPKVLQCRRDELVKSATRPFNVQPPVLRPGTRPFTVQQPAPFGRHAPAAAPAVAPHASAIRKPPAVLRAAQKTVGSRGAGGMVQLKPTPSGVSGAHAPRRFTQPPANNFQTRPSVIQTFKFRYEIASVTKTINTETYSVGTHSNEEPGMILWLQKILESDFDPETVDDLTKKDKEEIRKFISNLRGNRPTNRQMFGYNNPSHNSTLGLDLLEDGANTPYDSNKWNDKEEWLMSPNRNYVTYSPNSRTQDSVMTQGHSNVVLGHDEGASVHFNRVGHMQTPQQNQQYNQTKTAYHGLEQRPKSNKSGGSSARYVKPNQTLGSHQMYWDPTHKNYDPNYQK
ncbi:MAG TPA: hypothetical protein VEX60_15670 [Pyrinomonadaceae bacterium]|nr:hypothetical protein [Pyrinomonadaceae bacterium]